MLNNDLLNDPEQHYAKHLAVVNDRNEVVLQEDVYNSKGVLVAAKNTKFSKELAEKIAKHKLAVAIEQSVGLSNNLNPSQLKSAFVKIIEELSLEKLFNDQIFQNLLGKGISSLVELPIVIQKLTVLTTRFPQIYHRTLLCSLFSIAICQQVGAEEAALERVFIASMMIELGKLHLPEALVLKDGDYNTEEWRLMEGHVVIVKYFADSIANLPKGVGRAVLEHHERHDGFGYPKAKKSEELALEGQVIAIADTVTALVQKLVITKGYSYNAVAAVIQVGSSAHAPQLRAATLRLFKKFDLPKRFIYKKDALRNLVTTSLAKQERINQWFTIISELFHLHYEELAEEGNFRPFTLLSHLNNTIVSSGLLSPFQLKWLQGLVGGVKDEYDHHELEEFELRLNEIEYQCLFVMRMMKLQKKLFFKMLQSGDLAIHYFEELNDVLSGTEFDDELVINSR